jgi:hypothetical protein
LTPPTPITVVVRSIGGEEMINDFVNLAPLPRRRLTPMPPTTPPVPPPPDNVANNY